jgi:hypothetical protein
MNTQFVRVCGVCVWGLLSFLSYFLLRQYTTEQWMADHWWYAYHSLRHPGLLYLHVSSSLLFLLVLFGVGSVFISVCLS